MKVDLTHSDPSKDLGKVTVQDIRYFTPSIEDIRVGYECEIQDYKERWEWTRAKDDMWRDFASLIDNQKIRVPYLTKEQIEAEGWTSYQGSTLIALNRGDFYIWYSEFSKLLSIEEGKLPRKRTRFIGECKDINTFRYISKLLGI